MRIGIGVSAGTEVVCAALVVDEDDGTRSVEYRTVSADSGVNSDVGDLVSSAIDLMRSLTPAPDGTGAHSHERRSPDAIAVAYRTAEHAASIKSACRNSGHRVLLVPEPAAAHTYLDDSGLIGRYRTVTVVDIGATGTTASILDSATGVVRAQERTDRFGGDVVDDVVKGLVHGGVHSSGGNSRVRDDLRDDRGVGSARYRAVKEHLTTHDSAQVGGSDPSIVVDRADFDAAIRPLVVQAAEFAARTAASAGATSEALVLIGGGATVPLARSAFGLVCGVPVLTPSEPDTVLAQGAALLALTAPTGRYPTVGAGVDTNSRRLGRFGGAVVGALLVGGIVVAYGVQTLTPTDDASYSPAGSASPSADESPGLDVPVVDVSSSTEAVPPTAAQPGTPPYRQNSSGSGSPGTGISSTRIPSATPSLHPAPDLPVIPWPAAPSDVPDSADSPTPRPTTPVTTTPAPGGGVDVSPTDEPGTTPPVTTPETPVETPGNGSTEIVPPPEPSAGIPTTDVNAPPRSPDLTPPPTVWTAPPPASGSSGGGAEGETPNNAPTASSRAPESAAPTAETPR